MASKTCCRSCPRCADCPVLLAARVRHRGDRDAVASLVDEIFAGSPRRRLPEPVLRALETLDSARRGTPTPV
jgi:hypothetical protein